MRTASFDNPFLLPLDPVPFLKYAYRGEYEIQQSTTERGAERRRLSKTGLREKSQNGPTSQRHYFIAPNWLYREHTKKVRSYSGVFLEKSPVPVSSTTALLVSANRATARAIHRGAHNGVVASTRLVQHLVLARYPSPPKPLSSANSLYPVYTASRAL